MTDPVAPEDEGFVSRWSRRKRDPDRLEEDRPPAEPPVVVAEPAPSTDAAPVPGTVERARNLLARLTRRPAVPGQGPPPAFDLSSLPSIESLTGESDIAAFLQQGVPLVLRNAALRRIWTLDPDIRDFVGPLDYGWDFNAPDGVPGFSLDLGGADVKRLLAQAMGLLDEEAKDTDSPTTQAGEPAALASAPPAEQPAAHPLAVIPAEVPIPADGAPPAPPTPPRRRHGGAVPAEGAAG